jgi:alpha/beta superfamily hydrolase
MFRYLVFTLLALSLYSCQKLDSNLFSADNSIETYLWDDYPGDREFHIGPDFPVPENEFHTFSVESVYQSDRATIQGVYLGDLATIQEDTIIVYCHGNTGHMDFYWERMKLLYYTGEKSRYGVLMMDYRGFGLSEGTVNEAALAHDVAACIDWLTGQGASEDKLILYGFSLGSIPAVQICRELNYNPAKLILEAPIGNIDAMVQGGSSLSMPASYFVEIEADNIERIREVNEPMLLIHGLADSFLPYPVHGQPLFENHPGPVKMQVLVPEGEHGDTPAVYGLEEYRKSLDEFIRS